MLFRNRNLDSSSCSYEPPSTGHKVTMFRTKAGSANSKVAEMQKLGTPVWVLLLNGAPLWLLEATAQTQQVQCVLKCEGFHPGTLNPRLLHLGVWSAKAVGTHLLGQKKAEPGGQHGIVCLRRVSDTLMDSTHLAKLQLSAHTVFLATTSTAKLAWLHHQKTGPSGCQEF